MSTPGLTKDDLKEILKAVIAEARKPPDPTEKEQAEVEAAQQYRKEQREQVLEAMNRKRSFQDMCTHEHAMRDGGGTHCVHVRDDNSYGSSGYIYCQKCELRVRPDEPKMRKLDPQARFDTALFNKLFQNCNDSGMMGG